MIVVLFWVYLLPFFHAFFHFYVFFSLTAAVRMHKFDHVCLLSNKPFAFTIIKLHIRLYFLGQVGVVAVVYSVD